MSAGEKLDSGRLIFTDGHGDLRCPYCDRKGRAPKRTLETTNMSRRCASCGKRLTIHQEVKRRLYAMKPAPFKVGDLFTIKPGTFLEPHAKTLYRVTHVGTSCGGREWWICGVPKSSKNKALHCSVGARHADPVPPK